MTKRVKYFICCVLLTVVTVMLAFSRYFYTVRAETDSVKSKFESINVMDDLKDSTQNGEKLDLTKYNFDESKKTEVFSFVEFCYSFRSDAMSDYGLYIYVYNPQNLNIDVLSVLNTVSMRYGDDSSMSFKKYRLRFLNRSKGDYYGLFYKFEVVLSTSQREDILSGKNKVNSSCRKYEVSEVELKLKNDNNATAVEVGTIYEFTGYAKGYGADITSDKTLTCVAKGGQETISLNVKSTYYRPAGTNGKNDYTQDSLHSVYFAVPNHYIEKYGEMYAVHATWLNAVLKPMLVTGNKTAYNTFSKYLGVKNSVYNKDVDYMYVGGDILDVYPTKTIHKYGYLLNNVTTSSTSHAFQLSHSLTGSVVDPLYSIFYSGSDCDSADKYTVRSEKIYSEIEDSKLNYGGELVNGKFSKAIFESVDENFTEVNIARTEQYKLTSQKLTQNFWQKLFGTATITTDRFENISAIEKIDADKIAGEKKAVCDRLYISVSDYNTFTDYYKKYAQSTLNDFGEECTVYLFRYMVSDYIAQEATLYKYKSSLSGNSIEKVDTNAYFFQGTVNLDFDIIDLTFVKEDVKTVIPVVMSPIDIVHDATSPVYTKSDKNNLGLILLLLLLLLVIIILWPFLPTILKLVWSVITFPFKILAGIGKGISGAVKNKRAEKSNESAGKRKK